MLASSLKYHRPDSWEEALRLLARQEVRTLPLMLGPYPQALSDWKADAVVDLSRLEARYIRVGENGTIQIGALTTLQDLTDSSELRQLEGGLLGAAAFQVAPLGMRNLATLGGSLLEASGPPELKLALLVLDAVVVTRRAEGAAVEVPLAEFLQAARGEDQSGQVITEVSIPPGSGANRGWALERVARTPRDTAIVAAAARLEMDGERVKSARLAAAASNDRPQRHIQAEDLLVNNLLSEELLQAAADSVATQTFPLADYRGSEGYRRTMAGVLARRAISSAAKNAGLA
jgi:CO/xanthine dehydrogenase FAD-binding subunit